MTTTEQNDFGLTPEELAKYIHFIDQQRVAHQREVKLADSIKRLMDNEDFKFVIQEVYLTEMPKVFASMLAETTSEVQINKIMRDIHSTGAFRKWLGECLTKGEQAEGFIRLNDEEYINLIKQQSGDY